MCTSRPQENYNETVPLLEAAVAIQRETLGERHAQTTSSCEALKDVRSKQVRGLRAKGLLALV